MAFLKVSIVLYLFSLLPLSPHSLPAPDPDYDGLEVERFDFHKTTPTTMATTTTTTTTKPEKRVKTHPIFHPSQKHVRQSVERANDAKNMRMDEIINLFHDLGYFEEHSRFREPTNKTIDDWIKEFGQEYNFSLEDLLNTKASRFFALTRCGTTPRDVKQFQKRMIKPVYTYSSNIAQDPTYPAEFLKDSIRKAFEVFSNASGIEFVEYQLDDSAVDVLIIFAEENKPLAQEHFYGRERAAVVSKAKEVARNYFNKTSHLGFVDAIFLDYGKCWVEHSDIHGCNTTQRGSVANVSLVRTLLHELGHIFGLQHVKNPASFMYPFFQQSNGLLSESDIQLIRANVTQREEEEEGTREGPQRRYMHSLALCNGKFDGFHYLNNMIYITKGNLVWLMYPKSKALVSVIPTTLQALFPYYPHDRVTCLFTAKAGNLVGSYKNDFYNLLTGEKTNATFAPQFCIPFRNRILGSRGTGYEVLAERPPPSSASSFTNESGLLLDLTELGDVLETSQLDFVMHIPPDAYFYFKDGFFWIKDHFSQRISIRNETLYRIQDYWLKPYCEQDVSVSVRGLQHAMESAASIVGYLKALIERPYYRLRKPTPLIFLHDDGR